MWMPDMIQVTKYWWNDMLLISFMLTDFNFQIYSFILLFSVFIFSSPIIEASIWWFKWNMFFMSAPLLQIEKNLNVWCMISPHFPPNISLRLEHSHAHMYIESTQGHKKIHPEGISPKKDNNVKRYRIDLIKSDHLSLILASESKMSYVERFIEVLSKRMEDTLHTFWRNCPLWLVYALRKCSYSLYR